ncbi:DUF1642 domain-containing protein [Lacticaseibacillus paracasei]|uniref:DUF1642 domain-containing protein n=1 Tax=Lacticaseibacillus paracasei TaxID=1597 RepID=UPI001C1E8511|nr:DUF1642 domain-containing protein [Lacticaseibacillus paracasei]MBU6048333.1 DUF1642 domain-containing protein [Lacticaseibacillus paracasei]MCL4973152.1 DUF1642 domain-containing protein [Lacticaseibacillus paracasei]
MSNETKREVVEAILLAKDTDTIWDSSNVRYYLNRYDAALPDDLPVIPEAQSDWIKQCKANDYSLSFALGDEITPIEVAKTFCVLGGYTDKNKDKWLKLQNTFARAWLLGVWRVEETGEIVKLEADHG